MKTSFYFFIWTIIMFIFLQIDSAFLRYYMHWILHDMKLR